ncbi:hypothetical protein [Schaalia hyovaginalis]|uniref:hypothetical protein n=1 Tax=Schaalia hyovaginalis TaxID=29316 RepID=UPI0012B3C3EF|nr:hypothetical protein [Schaalia hyovaginalis]MST64797.1 hypothetical protein [Schaalia hyovaginalis]
MTRALLGIAALVVAIGAGAALGALLFRPVSPRGLEDSIAPSCARESSTCPPISCPDSDF